MRLIDADKLKETFQKEELDNDRMCRMCLDSMCDIIDNEPTVFYIDKVVQKLELAKSIYAELSLGYNNAEETKRYVSMEQTMALAIEIVKRGGLNV